MSDTAASRRRFARELWRRLESVHAVTYFAPESLEAAAGIGVRGFWRSYFGFRASPLGACSAGAVTAAFFGFSPGMVARAIPSVWELATPAAFLAARSSSAATALRRIAGDEVATLVDDGWTVDALAAATRRGSAGSLPLYLANRDVPRSEDPVADLWQVATTLREHRGDGHVAIWTARGLAPVEVAVLFVASGGTTREALQPHRGWSDEQWSAASERLAARRLIEGERPTEAGQQLVHEVEAATDDLAAAPFGGLDATDRRRLLTALDPVARSVGRSETIPSINPIGVPLLAPA